MSDNESSDKEHEQRKESTKTYNRGAFSKTIKDYLIKNGDDQLKEETIEYIEQLIIEFIAELTLKIRRDEPTKQIKPEDVLVNLIRDKNKFEKGVLFTYLNLSLKHFKDCQKATHTK